ncbi:MAG TPA: glycoside hydrolase family 32 protein, partial [Anaerolineae bacterium]|nr:glycoside hydrolase family 32 protein [Anaerolineae bacterium]
MSELEGKERYRPKFHFTPAEKWMNDPNGLVYYEGEYHLFYQYYPEDSVWGPMHWGHAVSRDLVRWAHLPIALYPDRLGYIYSGSVVIDWRGSAGFGAEAMVAIFTYHDPITKYQSQGLAYSVDKGRNWSKYEGNPVIEAIVDMPDFRDPKVVWYEEEEGAGHWVMVVAASAEKAILFYQSSNLIEWRLVSRFGDGLGGREGLWEMPELFPLMVTETGEVKWVLMVGVDAGAPAGGTGTQYFVGTFDGYRFVSEGGDGSVLWVDYGADFYAAQIWNDEPGGRRIGVGWMSNWLYGLKVPTEGWRGVFSVPRELSLVVTEEGERLVQRPVVELAQWRRGERWWRQEVVGAERPLVMAVGGQQMEIKAAMRLGVGVGEVELGFYYGEEKAAALVYERAGRAYRFERYALATTQFSELFAAEHVVGGGDEGGVLRW